MLMNRIDRRATNCMLVVLSLAWNVSLTAPIPKT